MSSNADFREGMEVYGADNQTLGKIDRVQADGLLVGGQFIPRTAIGRVERDGVFLIDSAVWLRSSSSEQGDSANQDPGYAASVTEGDSGGADVKLTTTPK